jgi:phosphoribosyl-ATP pyrophosphohydrolase/phosphoribosyl-AMP cyclohydrolase
MSRESPVAEFDCAALSFDAAGLLPVVAQDAFTGRVLMLAWANAEAVERTAATGEAHFWSRSRQSLWRKGETSGNLLRVVAMERDCDGDALLLRVIPSGPACHTGTTSCFDAASARGAATAGLDLGALEQIVAERADADPARSYTARLFAEGIERMAQKVGEEATEVVIAALAAFHSRDPEREKTGKGKPGAAEVASALRLRSPAPEAQGMVRETKLRLIEEASDLLFHLTVLLRASGVSTSDLAAELSARHQRMGQGTPDGRAPLPKKEAEPTPMPPEQSEPTDQRPDGERRR